MTGFGGSEEGPAVPSPELFGASGGSDFGDFYSSGGGDGPGLPGGDPGGLGEGEGVFFVFFLGPNRFANT